jgi:hypothetical protein
MTERSETAEPMMILLADCTGTILRAIEAGLPQREIASDYGLSIISEAHKGDKPDWSVINRAIVARWSEGGLIRIKREAWKLANRAGVYA